VLVDDSENSRLSGNYWPSANELLWAGVPNIQARDDIRDTLRPGRVTTKPAIDVQPTSVNDRVCTLFNKLEEHFAAEEEAK
jgi:hypothetical protein